MKLALIGYGKMGKAIEEIALERGHRVTLRISRSNQEDFTEANLKSADVAIEFTGPHSAFDNNLRIIKAGIPLVCGSTGWLDKISEVEALTKKLNGSFLYASNFSIGVNIFFEVNKQLARLMANQKTYEPHIEETHHTHKKDAPSGTAITLAEQVIKESGSKKEWSAGLSDNPAKLDIISHRIDPAPGTHEVRYSSEIDDISIMHTAHNRKGFALGAVLAAEFINGKKGIFSMQDVLQLPR